MIPIQCPKCGRTGNVPPDRLNARMVCKGCKSVFHMDRGGRMVLGTPEDPAKASKTRMAAPEIDFDLAATWQNVPRPAKIGVPAMVLLVAGWMVFPWNTAPDYESGAQAVGHALLVGDRSGVVALATPESADAAGKWYDLVHTSIAETGPGSVNSSSVLASLLSGNAEHDSSLGIVILLGTDTVNKTFTLPLVKADGAWRFDANKCLDDAQQAEAMLRLASKKK